MEEEADVNAGISSGVASFMMGLESDEEHMVYVCEDVKRIEVVSAIWGMLPMMSVNESTSG